MPKGYEMDACDVCHVPRLHELLHLRVVNGSTYLVCESCSQDAVCSVCSRTFQVLQKRSLDGYKRYVCGECFGHVQCGFCLCHVRKFRTKIARQDTIWFYLCKKCQRIWPRRFMRPDGAPTLDQIERRAAQIRATWTPEEREKRRQAGVRKLFAVITGNHDEE